MAMMTNDRTNANTHARAGNAAIVPRRTETNLQRIMDAALGQAPIDGRVPALSDAEALAVSRDWRFLAREAQWPPAGAWRSWVMLGGRGSGKTRAGAEWIDRLARSNPDFRIALVGETHGDVREVMVEGPAGLVSLGNCRHEPSRRRVVWASGAEALCFSSEDPEALRGPQFHAAWADQVGAPAVDKAANQPNVFPDPKSSENAAPHHSTGARDDAAQHAVLRAHLDHWNGDGPVAPSDVFAWTWDARPSPAFPLRTDIWSDGRNWSRGHWLNGRLSGAPVGEIVAAVLADHGFGAFDVSGVEGHAHGLLLDDPADARRSLDALMDVHGVSVSERDGTLEFRSRTRPRLPIGRVGSLAVEDGEPDARRTRAREVDRPGEIALAHRDPLLAHGAATVLARAPGATASRAAVATPLVLEGEVASGVAAQLLHAAREGRERAALAVPWSQAQLRAGDTVLGPREAPGRWLVEAIEDGASRHLSLVRAPNRTLAPSEPVPAVPPVDEPIAVAAPRAVALDLPLLPGAEGGTAFAAWMRPWRPLAVLTRSADGALGARAAIDAPATLGALAAPLAPGPVGPFDRANSVLLDCPAGAFSAASRPAVLNGANVLAVRCLDGWEVLQFTDAEEIAPGRWRLSTLLRARLGTDPAMRSGAPPGADIVLLNGALASVVPDPHERGEPLRWLVGPSDVPPDPARFATVDAALGARSETPPSPVHLRAHRSGDGLTLRWVRRSRVDADRWDVEEIALGEERERYRVRLVRGDEARTIETDRPELAIPPELAPASGDPLVATIAQLGARAGDAASITVH